MKKDFISLADLAPAEIQGLLDEAVALKAEWQRGGNKPLLGGKALGMIFQKPSLRTRVSFEMGMHHLGGSAICLSPDEIGLGKRESVADVARVLSSYVDGIMARVFAHSLILELARHSAVPVINGLSDYNHPCQGVADLLTIYEKLGSLKGVRWPMWAMPTTSSPRCSLAAASWACVWSPRPRPTMRPVPRCWSRRGASPQRAAAPWR